MGRATQYNSITSPEKIAKINPENITLKNDFMAYLRSTQKAASTIAVYENDLLIFFTYLMEYAGNKFFVDLKKRDIVSFQNWLVNENGNSPARVRRIKATLSSLSNYIESICDEDYPQFRNIIHKVESPVSQPVREKTVLSDEQLDGLLKSLIDKKQYEKACMLALAMCSGRRKSELVLFKTHYFASENLMYGSLYKTPETMRTKGRGNGKYIYCYTLAKQFQPYLDLWLAERKERGIESEWLFPSHNDPAEPLGISTMDGWARTFSTALGVPFYWHCLRHYFTTHLVRAGLPDSVIQDIIGWTSADMLRIYTDISVDEQIGKYFTEDGIVAGNKATLNDL